MFTTVVDLFSAIKPRIKRQRLLDDNMLHVIFYGYAIYTKNLNGIDGVVVELARLVGKLGQVL